jgi:hypothetical protein
MEEEEVQTRGEEKDAGLICLFSLATSSSDFPCTECPAAERARSDWKDTAVGDWGMRKGNKTRVAEGSLRPGPALRVRAPSETMDGLGKNCLDLEGQCSPFWLEQSGSSLSSNSSECREGADGVVGDHLRSLLGLPKELESKAAPWRNGFSPLGHIMFILEPSQVSE